MARDAPVSAIEDLDRALKLRADHAPSLALRARARCRLGQFPEAKRDCAKAWRLSLKNANVEAPEPGADPETLPQAVLKALRPLGLLDLQAEVERGQTTLHLLGVDDPNSSRVFQSTAEGLLLRRRDELQALDEVGRSKRRTWLEKRRKRHDDKLAAEGLLFEEEERYVFEARMLSDRCRADLAARKAAYDLERMEDERRRREEREAKRLAEEALVRDREY